MRVDRGFVREYERFVRAVHDPHDVHVVEFRTAFAPVGVRHAVMTSDLPAGVELSSGWDCPMKERIIARDRVPEISGGRFDVFEERRETSDHAAIVQALRHAQKSLEAYVRFSRTRFPQVAHQLAGSEFALEGGQHAPFLGVQLDDLRVERLGQRLGPFAGCYRAAPYVADA